MNKHFLRTMKRVLRDLEKLNARSEKYYLDVKEGQNDTIEYNVNEHVERAKMQIVFAIGAAESAQTPDAPPTEQPADTTMHTHYEQQEGQDGAV